MSKKIPLSTIIADKLAQYIQDNGLTDGSRLPNEFELSELLDVSRITIREAVKILSAKGLVEVRRGIGTFVCSNPEKNEVFFDLSELTDEEIAQQAFDIRCSMEPMIASIAAQKATEDDIMLLTELTSQIKVKFNKYKEGKYTDTELATIFIDHEMAFHTQLAKCSQNIFFERFIFYIMQTYVDSYWKVNFTPQDLSFNAYHENIVAAIKSKDSQQAYDAMQHHLFFTSYWPENPSMHQLESFRKST